MLAAVLARGRTRLQNAACEPEVVDLAHLLTKMGARRSTAREESEVVIDGVDQLHGAEHAILPDRIEAGTYAAAAAATRGDVLPRRRRLVDAPGTAGRSSARWASASPPRPGASGSRATARSLRVT